MKYFLSLLLLIMIGVTVVGQKPLPSKKDPGTQELHDRLDSVLAMVNTKRSKIRSYDSIITKNAISYHGLFNVHSVRDSFFFEIPAALLLNDMQLISTLEKGKKDAGGGLGGGKYPGESLGEKTCFFKLGADSSLYLCEDKIVSQGDPASRIYTAVQNASTKSVLQTFPIIALTKDRSGYLIDATGLLKGRGILNDAGGGYLVDFLHAYPENVEISISSNEKDKPIFVTHFSFIGLPQVPLQQRLFDRRVGYFTKNTFYFTDQQQEVEEREFICRWRLEPRPEDQARWERGELVEPKKPIVYYIDPATPTQWVKYLILGVNDWQKAFERAGFRNAIIGKEWPKGDSVHLDDARFSFICYLPSETANAYGPQINDPRSGEVIQTHIGWYHNVMTILHDWFMIQTGATDPNSRKAKFDDELMGQLIRFVSSHEVGHTLGLRHNFGSSSQTPVEKLRDKAWLEVHGHTASIMDYARFDYVAQPEDHIPEVNLFPRIGEYDCWAIQWGYKYSGTTDVQKDKLIVDKWATDSLASNPRLWFGSQEAEKLFANPYDPRCQTEDLGDNNMTASTYGIKNLQRILPELPAWVQGDGNIYNTLTEAYNSLLGQFRRYMGHVLTNVGGTERTYKSEEAQGDVYEPVPKAKQQQALLFFNEQLFTTPTWLLNPVVTEKVSQPAYSNFVQAQQTNVLNELLSTGTLNKIEANVTRYGRTQAWTLDEYLSTLHGYIWKDLEAGKPMDLNKRMLQKTYTVGLEMILENNDATIKESDIYSAAWMDLLRVQKEAAAALPRYPSGMDRYHLESLLGTIKTILNPGL